MVFKTWNHGKKKRKRKAILLLAYIADVSCLTNRPFYHFYMRTLSLNTTKTNEPKYDFSFRKKEKNDKEKKPSQILTILTANLRNDCKIIHIAKMMIPPTKTAPATLRYQLYSRTLSGHNGNKQTTMAPNTINK